MNSRVSDDEQRESTSRLSSATYRHGGGGLPGAMTSKGGSSTGASAAGAGPSTAPGATALHAAEATPHAATVSQQPMRADFTGSPWLRQRSRQNRRCAH